jgi:hypothetical protein
MAKTQNAKLDQSLKLQPSFFNFRSQLSYHAYHVSFTSHCVVPAAFAWLQGHTMCNIQQNSTHSNAANAVPSCEFLMLKFDAAATSIRLWWSEFLLVHFICKKGMNIINIGDITFFLNCPVRNDTCKFCNGIWLVLTWISVLIFYCHISLVLLSLKW